MLPHYLPDDWTGALALLAIVFVVSGFLDNIAAALIGGAAAHTLFRGRVRVSYLAAIVAAANSGGAGSVLGDTTTTMMWIAGIPAIDVLHAYVAAVVAFLVFARPAARAQHRFAPILRDRAPGLRVDWVRVAIVGFVMACAVVANVIASFAAPQFVERFLVIGAAVAATLALSLGFVGPDLFVDQHFLKRGRIGRILPVMVQTGYKLGLGIEEDTAAIVHGRTVEVIGAKGVLLVDLGAATHDDSLGAFNLRNARLSYLDRGDRHDFASGVTTPSPQKLAGMVIDPNAPDFRPYNRRAAFHGDILGDSAIVNAMNHLIDNRESEAVGLALPPPGGAEGTTALGFEFRLKRDAESRGWYTGAFGGEDYTK